MSDDMLTPLAGDAETIPATQSTRKPQRKRPLTLRPRFQRFAQEYWASGQALDAAAKAGFNNNGRCRNTQRQAAWRILHDPEVQDALRKMSLEATEDLQKRRGRLIEELTNIAYADICTAVDVNAGDVQIKDFKDIDTRAIQSVKKSKSGLTVTMYDKLKAIDTLARISGLEVQHVDVTSNGATVNQAPVNIVFEVVAPPARDADKDISGEAKSTAT